MRLTRERLLNLTNSYLTKMVRRNPNVVCIYLTGSMLQEDPFINGTTDVDLVVVHNRPEDLPRKIVPITDEATLDIHYFQQSYFNPMRKIRKDPWLGSGMCFDPIQLYGKGHWFEFTQASIESAFFQPEYVLHRSRVFFAQAYESWRALRFDKSMSEARYILNYLRTIESICNSVAALSQHPLTDRRILKDFKAACDAVEIPDVVPLMNQLLIGETDPKPYFEYFSAPWKYYLEFFGNSELVNSIPKYHIYRLKYYTAAVETYWEEHLISALWIMLKTWSVTVEWLNLHGNEYYTTLLRTIEIGRAFSAQREEQLGKFIDAVDVAIEKWGDEHGFTKLESDFIQ